MGDLPQNNTERRQFLIQAAALAFSAGTLAALLEACTATAPTAPQSPPASSPAPTPTPSPTSPPVARPAPTPAPAAVPKTERSRIGHLLRRAGFGASQEELDRFTAMGVSATVDYLVDYESIDDSEIEGRLAGLNLNIDNLADLQRWWLLRMVYTRRPLQEKMTLFWHGLLTSGFSKVGRGPYMYDQNRLLREMCLGRYDELLKAIARDPAMLIWLDSQVNKKFAPNENFARELMELFSMGIGPYTEDDVRQSARAFTGWGLRRKAFYFTPEQHDFGSKTFLGRTDSSDGDDIIDVIMEQPATAEFVSRKLFAFFAYDDPGPEVVARLAGTFRDTRYNVREVMRQLLKSPEFYSGKAYRTRIKSPVELVAGTMRSLEIATDGTGLAAFADRMGQSLFNPFDVSGWPGGAAWINSGTLLQRLNFANTAVTARSRNFQYNPQQTVQQLDLLSAKKIVTYFVDLLLDGNMNAEELNVITRFGEALNALGDTSTAPGTTVDEKLRGVIYLVLASPDYQAA